jgi:quinol monooxygenase YgiN
LSGEDDLAETLSRARFGDVGHGCDEREKEPPVWAQLMKVQSKPDRDSELQAMFEQVRAVEQPDSGLVRTTVMRSQHDPEVVYVLVVFESEEKARAREQDPRRQEGMKALQASMAQVMDGPPEFIDLAVLRDT